MREIDEFVAVFESKCPFCGGAKCYLGQTTRSDKTLYWVACGDGACETTGPVKSSVMHALAAWTSVRGDWL